MGHRAPTGLAAGVPATPASSESHDDAVLPRRLIELARDPGAVCLAVAPSGAELVAAPRAVASLFPVVLDTGGPLDNLDNGSYAAAVSLFDAARRTGEAAGTVCVAGDPPRPHRLDIFDLTDALGCLVAVVTAADESTAAPPAGIEAPRPRRMLLRLGVTGLITWVDDDFVRALGWQRDELIGRSALDLIEEADHERSITYWSDVLTLPGATGRLRQRWRNKAGQMVWMEATEFNRLHEPHVSAIEVELVDIDDEMAAQTALHEREELLARVTEALPTGILQVDADGAPAFSNERWFELTGLDRDSTLRDLLMSVDPGDRPRVEEAVERTRRTHEATEVEFAVSSPGRDPGVCRLRLCTLSGSSDRPSMLATLEDITRSHRVQRQLIEAAERDPLTGILNRSAILDRLEMCMKDAASSTGSVGLLFVDLDDFKSVNDRLGHAAGDELLCQVARTIEGTVRKGDLVGRLGGDEFVVIVPEITHPRAAHALADRIDKRLRSITICDGEHLVTGSIGIATGQQSTTAAELLAAADDAMYDAKRSRRAASS